MSQRQDPLKQALFEYLLRLGDTSLILGHRLSEWCAHGPTLEEDIALSNLALDQIGRARMLLTYAAKVEGRGRTEDDLAYLRDGREYRNYLLVEQPNGDFAFTIARQLLHDAFCVPLYESLTVSEDAELAAIAAKAVKEGNYHLKHSTRWTLRLGDGTQLSHDRIQDAVDGLWMYTGELFETDDVDRVLVEAGLAVDPASIKPAWERVIESVLHEATLTRPDDGWMQQGGKTGLHSEHLGRLLAEMQHLQRSYPGTEW